MELKKGYKQTAIGIIPEDWSVNILDNLSSKIGDGIHTTPKYNANGDYYFINGNNLKGGKIEYSDDTKRVAKEEYQIHKKDLNNSTVLLSINGTIGNLAFYNNENIVLGKSAAYIILNDKINKELFYQLMQTKFVYKYFENELTGSTIKNLGLGSIRNIPIPLPSTKSEQSTIATALSGTDNLINNLEKLIAKKRNIKQGITQLLLTGKKRLPNFSGEWVTKRLGDIFTLATGKSKSVFIEEGGQYIIMDMGSVSIEGKIIGNKKTNYRCDFLDQGDLIMPKDDIGGGNIIGKVAFINENNRYILGDHVYRLRNKEVNSLFFSYLINSFQVNRSLRSKVIGSAQLGLNRKSIEEQLVKIPSESDEQSTIANILSDMDSEIAALEFKLDKYRNTKLGMMQNLLTGKIRLI